VNARLDLIWLQSAQEVCQRAYLCEATGSSADALRSFDEVG
jgi:hypothetical protein